MNKLRKTATKAGDSRCVKWGWRLHLSTIPRGHIADLRLSVGGIRRDLRCWKFLLVFIKSREVFSRCIPFFTFEEMFSGVDPRSAKVGGEVIAVSHHVMVSYVKVIFDVSPFIIGEKVTEW